MIKGKYKPAETIKDSGYKLIQKCIREDSSVYFLKAYSQQQAKLIQNQIQTYQKLKQPHLHGFPEIKEAFEENGKTYLVIEQLGDNLEHLRVQCGGRFTLKTALMVGLQLIDRIEYLHTNGIVHADIKPSNFLIGKGKMKHKIYLTDFQLSVPYMKKGKHILEQTKDKFNGSLRFSSRAANSRLTLSRKDDIESWAYSIIFLCKGQLPWMKINSINMIAANEQFLSLKNKSREQLLSGLPTMFSNLMGYVDELKFTTAPDYERIRGYLIGLMKKNGYQMDYKYDWEYL